MTEQPEVVDARWDDETEDQFKRTWDFYREDGSPVDTLAELEMVTGRPARDLAMDLIRLPFGKAAPVSLIDEALGLLGG